MLPLRLLQDAESTSGESLQKSLGRETLTCAYVVFFLHHSELGNASMFDSF